MSHPVHPPIRPAARLVAGLLAVLVWGALALQLWIVLRNAATAGKPLGPALVSFFSFFTVLSNLLAALAFTAMALPRPPRLLRPLAEPPGATAVTVYMTVVGITYSLLLRQLWAPTGWQKAADVLLHDVAPVASVAFWLAGVPKGRLAPRDAIGWLIYPALYAGYAFVRGAVTGEYPYPFIDVAALGAGRAFLNALLLTAAFLVLSLVYIGVDRALGRRPPSP